MRVLSPANWGVQGVWMIRVIVLARYEVPVGACCLTEHVGPLLLPVECQQAGLQYCTAVSCKDIQGHLLIGRKKKPP